MYSFRDPETEQATLNAPSNSGNHSDCPYVAFGREDLLRDWSNNRLHCVISLACPLPVILHAQLAEFVLRSNTKMGHRVVGMSKLHTERRFSTWGREAKLNYRANSTTPVAVVVLIYRQKLPVPYVSSFRVQSPGSAFRTSGEACAAEPDPAFSGYGTPPYCHSQDGCSSAPDTAVHGPHDRLFPSQSS